MPELNQRQQDLTHQEPGSFNHPSLCHLLFLSPKGLQPQGRQELGLPPHPPWVAAQLATESMHSPAMLSCALSPNSPAELHWTP